MCWCLCSAGAFVVLVFLWPGVFVCLCFGVLVNCWLVFFRAGVFVAGVLSAGLFVRHELWAGAFPCWCFSVLTSYLFISLHTVSLSLFV